MRRARRLPLAWLHGAINLVVLGLASVNSYLRAEDMLDVVPLGLGLSVVTGTLLAISGWLGGELTFRHGIGVSEQVGTAAPDANNPRPHLHQG